MGWHNFKKAEPTYNLPNLSQKKQEPEWFKQYIIKTFPTMITIGPGGFIGNL